jgi:chromate transporter
VLLVATRLGLTSFGGPIAHLGYFRTEYVQRRRWLDDAAYLELVALAQALPGPASSQVGIAIGQLRAGLLGGLCAWLGFTLPSAALLVAFAYGIDGLDSVEEAAWLHGLKVAAVAVVAFAIWGMARALAPDRERVTIAIAATLATLASPTVGLQLVIIVAAGLYGWLRFSTAAERPSQPAVTGAKGRETAIIAFAVFLALLAGLPLARALFDSQGLALADSFYRVGALVFGGGHVVLPLLNSEVVAPGWVTEADFLAGYGAAQAIPGPLFTFSAYLGAVSRPEPNGIAGAAIACVAIFAPSFLLVTAGLPLWNRVRSIPALQGGLRGINAGVVGLLVAAFYDPIWVSAIDSATAFGIGLTAFGLLAFWQTPPVAVVLFCAGAGAALL